MQLFKIKNLKSEVFTNGEYILDFTNTAVERLVNEYIQINLRESRDTCNNFVYRDDCKMIAKELKLQFAEYFI